MHVAVIIPYRPQATHETLLWTLEGLAQQELDAGDSLEILVGLDGGAESRDVPQFTNCRHVVALHLLPRMAAAAVRNELVRRASRTPDLLIFVNADTRPAPDLVFQHARTMTGLPARSLILGAAPWERFLPRVLDTLIDQTPMVFSYCHLHAQEWYSFRAAYSLNLSVRHEDFREAGGFPEPLRPYGYEDLAFGCRVLGPERKGLLFQPAARVLHRHPMTFEQYLDREELLGMMTPVLAKNCPQAFAVLMAGRSVEKIAADFRQKLAGDLALYRRIYQRLRHDFAQPAESLGEGETRRCAIDALYQLHIPVRLLAFRLGFLRGLDLVDDLHWQARKPAGLWRAIVENP
jgi:hypothetical protein